MDAEKRKAYNKEYYQKNRDKILTKALNKTECEFCKKSVIFYNIQKHQQTSICKRKEALLKEQSLRRSGQNTQPPKEEQKPQIVIEEMPNPIEVIDIVEEKKE